MASAALSLSSMTKNLPHSTSPCALLPTALMVANAAGGSARRSTLTTSLCAQKRAWPTAPSTATREDGAGGLDLH